MVVPDTRLLFASTLPDWSDPIRRYTSAHTPSLSAHIESRQLNLQTIEKLSMVLGLQPDAVR